MMLVGPNLADGPEYEKRLDGLKVTNNVGPTGADSKVVRLELI